MMPGVSPDFAGNGKDFPASSPLTGGGRESVPPTPGDVEHKYHAGGAGFILGVQAKGGSERSELVRIQRRG